MLGTKHYGQVTESELRANPDLSDWQVEAKINSEDFAFYNAVTVPLLEKVDLFEPLYSAYGRPSVNPAILVSAMIYGTMHNISERALVERVLSSDSAQIALGVYKSPTGPLNRERLIQLRKRMTTYATMTGINIMDQAISLITNRFADAMGINGEFQRMDSTLVQANIRVRGRIDLIYTSIYDTCKAMFQTVSAEFVHIHNLADLRKYTERAYRNQFLYRKAEETFDKVPELFDAYRRLCQVNDLTHGFLKRDIAPFRVMMRVFKEHTTEDPKTGVRRLYVADDHAMHSGILQSTYDLDCAYREKNSLIIRGYVVNTLEGVGANGSLVMVWQLAPANVNDITLFEQYLNSLPDIPREKGLKKLSVDAAYYSDKIAVLAEKKGLLLLPSDLTGKDIEPLWADFQLNEEGTRVIGCPNDNEILDCLPLTKQGRMTVHLNLDGCEGCPHRDICKVREVKGAKGKKVASVSVSPKSICRARIQEQLGTDAYQPYQHLRNGVETIQSILKNVYGLTRMRYKSLVKNKIHLACAIGALNFRKYLGFLNDTGRYAENPLLW